MTHRCPKCGVTLPEGVPAWVRSLRVADAMTPEPLTLEPEDTLARALEVMRLHGIRRVPIVLAGVLVGLLAEGDLKRAQPSTLDANEEEFQRVMEGTPISRIMIDAPITVDEQAPLLEAVRTLQSNKFGALPVLRDGQLCGILTDTDLTRVLGDLLQDAG
jgi:acetoin utilization protein AcuB